MFFTFVILINVLSIITALLLLIYRKSLIELNWYPLLWSTLISPYVYIPFGIIFFFFSLPVTDTRGGPDVGSGGSHAGWMVLGLLLLFFYLSPTVLLLISILINYPKSKTFITWFIGFFLCITGCIFTHIILYRFFFTT
jgi:hypothetical protein